VITIIKSGGIMIMKLFKFILILSFLLFIVKLTSCHASPPDNLEATLEQAPPSLNIELWQQLYLDKINEYSDPDNLGFYTFFEYSLNYIDDDEIPELIIHTHTSGNSVQIYTVSNDKLEVLYTKEPLYIERENIFYSSGGRMDNYWDKVYTIQNGVFVVVHEGSWRREFEHVDENNTVWEEFYYWDNEEVTEDEYCENIEIAFDKSKASKSWKNVFTYAEIIEIIMNYK
jgi:hypothetical protein